VGCADQREAQKAGGEVFQDRSGTRGGITSVRW
jgi:hypothetical protein